MKDIVLGRTLKLEINNMTNDEKLQFAKQNLNDYCMFRDKYNMSFEGPYRLVGYCEGIFISAGGHHFNECKLEPKKKIIPWTLETAESVQLRRKENGAKVWFNYGGSHPWFVDANSDLQAFSYSDLLEDFETVDGRPCGTEEK